MQHEDSIRVRHMIEAVQTALGFISGRQAADLDSDRMLLFALMRAIEVIGEAASKVSEEARRSSPEIPWSLIVSMRNRLIHAYYDIDREILWKTVTSELPALLPRLQAVLKSE
jgi:uncharacterized protein with HEPN domain